MYKWCNANLLTINCKKSQWLKINLMDREKDDTVITLGKNTLEKVSEYKYLWLLIHN